MHTIFLNTVPNPPLKVDVSHDDMQAFWSKSKRLNLRTANFKFSIDISCCLSLFHFYQLTPSLSSIFASEVVKLIGWFWGMWHGF